MTTESLLSNIPSMNPQKLKTVLKDPPSNDVALFKLIVDAPFQLSIESALLFLGIIVLELVDKKTGMINRVALSSTELAQEVVAVSVKPFNEINIPIDYSDNIIAEAIQTGTPQDTTDWEFLCNPVLDPDQARINQASAGIAYSSVYPFTARDGGALTFSYYQYPDEIGAPQHDFMKTYTALVNKLLKK